MWYAVYDKNTKDLISIGQSVASPLPDSMSMVEFEDKPEGNWNGNTLSFDPVVTTVEYEWYIDVGPFFDRFGQKALAVVSSEDAMVKGLVLMTLSRKWIDLKRPDVGMFLGLLVSKGLIDMTDLQRILTTPVSHSEQSALVRSYF